MERRVHVFFAMGPLGERRRDRGLGPGFGARAMRGGRPTSGHAWSRRGVDLAIALVALLVPVEARAQCGASTSECRNCHEVRGAKSVLEAPTPWHADHAFGDFCALCHLGNPQIKDEAAAHVGLVSPLVDPQASCGSCHGARSESLARMYVLAAMAPARPAEPRLSPSAGSAATSGPRVVAWRNVGLASLVFLVGGAGGLYAATNERRLRAEASRPKGVT